MFEPSEMYASQTTCACYKWASSRTLFSHSGVNSTEHGMFDHIGPVRHKTLFLPHFERGVVSFTRTRCSCNDRQYDLRSLYRLVSEPEPAD